MKNERLKFTKYFLVVILGTGAVLQLTGCTTGPKFMPVTSIPGKSVVYIYRPSKFIASGNAFHIWVNQKHLTDLSSGGYFVYTTEPGEQCLEYKTAKNPLNFGLITLLEKKEELIKFNAEADTTYYLKFETTNSVNLKHFVVCKAKIIDEGVALKQISKCKKTKPASS